MNLYVGSALVLAPIAIVVGIFFGFKNLLLATPLLVAVLFGVLCAYCYPDRFRLIKNTPELMRKRHVHQYSRMGFPRS